MKKVAIIGIVVFFLLSSTVVAQAGIHNASSSNTRFFRVAYITGHVDYAEVWFFKFTLINYGFPGSYGVFHVRGYDKGLHKIVDVYPSVVSGSIHFGFIRTYTHIIAFNAYC